MRLLSPDYRPLPTLDGHITVRPNNNKQAFAFFDAVGRPELKDDPRFTDGPDAHRERARLLPRPGRDAGDQDHRGMAGDLREGRRPGRPYNTIDDLMDDPHLQEVGFWHFDEHPTEGRIRRTRVANTFSGGMREETLPAPQLGRNTREVLAEMGYDEERITAMLDSGAAFEGVK
jgi:crotonobetainyl-CoA:carnitine CoA-transferase CaiB-like acyl-CoA transferase